MYNNMLFVQEVLDPLQPAGRPLPVFMGGISMGGTLTVLTALRDQSCWQVWPQLHSDTPSYCLELFWLTLGCLHWHMALVCHAGVLHTDSLCMPQFAGLQVLTWCGPLASQSA